VSFLQLSCLDMLPPFVNCHCLLQYLLKHQLGGQWLYPVHRLDRATSGVVLYCLSNEAASQLSRSLREREVKKVGVGCAQ
jgi:23S rRNA-/tRNA-specific pseudouridylate synthase